MSRDDSKNRGGMLDAARRIHDAHRRHGRRAFVEEPEPFLDMRRLGEERRREHEEQRARRHGRPPLSTEAIAAVGIAIADAQGVEEVSMRKIAGALGVGTMSLYHYVRTKEDLLAAMEDLIMGEIIVPASELAGGWRDAMAALARHTRQAYLRHPWALTLQGKGETGGGRNSFRHAEQSLAALAGTGLGFDDKMAILIVVDDYVFGHSLRARVARAERQFGSEGSLRAIGDFISAELRSGEYPEFSRLVGDDDPIAIVRKMAGFDPERLFEIGLGALLDGLEQHYGLSGVSGT